MIKSDFAQKRLQRYKKKVKGGRWKVKSFCFLTIFCGKALIMCGKMRNFAPELCELLIMTPAEYIQLKAFARQDGALLALLWVCAFILYIIGVSNSILGMAALMLMLYTPFFVGERLGKFRDYGREGLISFRRGYAYSVLVFFYGGVLFAVAQYLYFTYMDNGFLLSQFSKMVMSEEAQKVLKQYGMTQMVDESLQEMAHTRPIDYALNMLTVNISLGFILGLPISLFMQRTRKIEKLRD